jgi:hypothetical protein
MHKISYRYFKGDTMLSKFEDWLSMSTRLKTLKAKEMKTRKELCNEIFQSRSGALKEKFELGDYSVVAEMGVSFKLDEAGLKAMWEELSEEETQAVAWKPALKLAAYKKLSADKLIHECVTSKPAAPTLKMTKIE